MKNNSDNYSENSCLTDFYNPQSHKFKLKYKILSNISSKDEAKTRQNNSGSNSIRTRKSMSKLDNDLESNIHKRSTSFNNPNYLNQEFYLLPPASGKKKTLVLDLDETLVHSGIMPFNIPSDLVLQINIENEILDIHVLIRPGVNEFLRKMSKHYELVLFTASISKYAEPLLKIIDKNELIAFKFYRDHCTLINTNFVKDLSKLGRNLEDVIILDNSHISYALHHDNGIPIESWFDDKNDTTLTDLIPILEFLAEVDDVRKYINLFVRNNAINYFLIDKILEFSKQRYSFRKIKLLIEKEIYLQDVKEILGYDSVLSETEEISALNNKHFNSSSTNNLNNKSGLSLYKKPTGLTGFMTKAKNKLEVSLEKNVDGEMREGNLSVGLNKKLLNNLIKKQNRNNNKLDIPHNSTSLKTYNFKDSAKNIKRYHIKKTEEIDIDNLENSLIKRKLNSNSNNIIININNNSGYKDKIIRNNNTCRNTNKNRYNTYNNNSNCSNNSNNVLFSGLECIKESSKKRIIKRDSLNRSKNNLFTDAAQINHKQSLNNQKNIIKRIQNNKINNILISKQHKKNKSGGISGSNIYQNNDILLKNKYRELINLSNKIKNSSLNIYYSQQTTINNINSKQTKIINKII